MTGNSYRNFGDYSFCNKPESLSLSSPPDFLFPIFLGADNGVKKIASTTRLMISSQQNHQVLSKYCRPSIGS